MHKNQRLMEVFIVAGLLITVAVLVTPGLNVARERNKLAKVVQNGRTIKLAMDQFAVDHTNLYPSAETSESLSLPPPRTTNDLFHQLFIAGAIDQREPFWIKNAQVCNRNKPHGSGDPLQAGENGWACIENQVQYVDPLNPLSETNFPNCSRPLLFPSPLSASGLIFDTEIWNLKHIVVRIDGSVKVERLNQAGHLLDGDNKQLLTPASEVWDSTTPSIAYPTKP